MAKLKYRDFGEVIAVWSTKTLLAHRLSLSPNTIVRWAFSNSIPPQYWRALCAVSRGRVTIDNLLDLAEAKAKRMPVINNSPRRSQDDFVRP